MRLAASFPPDTATKGLAAVLDGRAATNRIAPAIACGAQNLSFAVRRMAPTTRDEARAAADRFNARSIASAFKDDGDDDECASGAADESRNSSYEANTAPAPAEAATPAAPALAEAEAAPAEVEAEYEADRAEAEADAEPEEEEEEEEDSAAAANFSARKARRTRAAHAATTRAKAISCAPSLSRRSTADRRG